MRRNRMSTTGAVLAAVCLVLVVAGCDDGPPLVLHQFPTDGPSPTFELPRGNPGACGSPVQPAQLSLLDPATGAPRWETAIPWTAEQPVPAGADKLVVAARGQRGRQSLVALRAGDGRPMWQRGVSWTFGAAPVRAHGSEVLTIDRNRVVAFSADDGTERWRHDGTVGAGGFEVEGDTVVAVDTSGQLTALDATSGATRWDLAVGPSSSARIVGESVIVSGEDGVVRAVDLASGARRWEHVPERGARSSYALGSAGGQIVLTERGEGTPVPVALVAVDPATGRTAWRNDPSTTEAAPSLVGDLVVLAEAETLTVLDAGDGRTRWSIPLAAQAVSRPAPDVVLVSSRADPVVVAVDAATGHERWRSAVGASLPSLPRSSGDGVVYLGGATADGGEATGGQVTAVEVPTGVTRWTTPRDRAVQAEPVRIAAGLAVVSSQPMVGCL